MSDHKEVAEYCGKRLDQVVDLDGKENPIISQVRDRYVSIMNLANQVCASNGTALLIEGMLDLMLEISEAEVAHFFELDQGTGQFVLKIIQGKQEGHHLIGLRLTAAQIFPDFPVDGTQPIVIGDISFSNLWLQTTDPLSAAEKTNMILLPVQHDAHQIGIIQIFNYRGAEPDLLCSLSVRLAMEIHQRNHAARLVNSHERLIRLLDILGEVAGTLDRNKLLHLVTENSSKLVNAERCSLFLVDPDTKDMVFQVAYQPSDEEKSASAKQKKSNSASPFGTPLNIPSNQPESDFQFFNRSAITMPLSNRPVESGQRVQRKNVFGGLMAITKPDSFFDEEDARLLQILASQTSTFLQVAEMYESAGELYLGAIKALVAAIDAKDPYTQGHSQRVSDYSVLISKELGLDEDQINDIRIGSLLHDIGKIGIPDSILLKSTTLTPEEFEIIERHPKTGVKILSQVQLLESMLPAISEHHERLDGSGYPNHKSDNISLMGRIVAVADVFDAMTSHRPYRPALSFSEVTNYLQANANILFDANCVNALVNLLKRSSGFQ